MAFSVVGVVLVVVGVGGRCSATTGVTFSEMIAAGCSLIFEETENNRKMKENQFKHKNC